MSAGARQPLQPEVFLSMMDVLPSRTASNSPGPQPALHPQAPLGTVPAEEQPRTTSHLKGQEAKPAPPRIERGDGSLLCCPEKIQSLQVSVDRVL